MNNFGHFKGINSKPFGAFKSSGGFGAMQSRVQGRSLNEASKYTSAIEIMLDGKGARIDVFRPDSASHGWKFLYTENTKTVEETIQKVKDLTSYGHISLSVKGLGDKTLKDKLFKFLGTLKNIN